MGTPVLPHGRWSATRSGTCSRSGCSPGTGFDGKGHSLTVDHGWGEVFDDVLAWLRAQVGTGRALRP